MCSGAGGDGFVLGVAVREVRGLVEGDSGCPGHMGVGCANISSENAARAVHAVRGQVPTIGYPPPQIPTSPGTSLVPTSLGTYPMGLGT